MANSESTNSPVQSQPDQVVSSKWTLFLSRFFPLIWTIFMGGLVIFFVFFAEWEGLQEPFTPLLAKVLLLGFYLSSLALFYLLFLRLKFVALDKEYVYVSNFLKTYRYTYDSIERIEESQVLFTKRLHFYFPQKTAFGKQITFIPSRYWSYYLEKHPEVTAQLKRD